MDKEPELIYSNFLIPKLGKLFKFNLIKKLALVQRIAESFNIKTIYGTIELKRHEITSYTLRAISLLIASGRLTKLYVPYRNAEGILFLVDRMEGMTYLGSLFHDVSFEIHHFKNEKEQMHAIWARDDKSLNPEYLIVMVTSLIVMNSKLQIRPSTLSGDRWTLLPSLIHQKS
jgi:hypothetical protein